MAGIPVEGDGIEWLIAVASYAQQFFSVQERMKRRPEGAVPGESLPSATIAEFLTYLKEKLGQDQWPKVMRVLRVLDTMATTGMLLDTGGELFNRSYITADAGTRTQKRGWLHLSEVLGAALIIPTYGAITIPITGTNRETGNRDIGSGLVLNNRFVLTNSHVIRDMELDGEIPTPKQTPPGMVDWRAMPETIKVANACARPDDHLDVGIIEIEVGGGAPGLSWLCGVAFREPVWGDETYALGYPAIATSDDAYLGAEHGSVVSPDIGEPSSTERDFASQHGQVVAPSVGSYMTDVRYFYYSAVTRPGTSGGPIVAQDGRVIGIVAHSPYDKANEGARHYRGIPTHQIVRALSEPPLSELFPNGELPIKLEDWNRG